LDCRPRHGGLSHDAEDWTKFGEYLGGTLGGIFGLLAFIGVLITIIQQRKQHDLAQGQSRRDELQRLLGMVSSTVDRILAHEPRHFGQAIRELLKEGIGTPMTVFSILSAVGTAAIQPHRLSRWRCNRYLDLAGNGANSI
jgi:hypothetical protein